LYQCFDIDEVTPIQFVGVYVTRWRPAWGEPTVMFCEVEDNEALAFAAQLDEVRALVEAAIRNRQWWASECLDYLCSLREGEEADQDMIDYYNEHIDPLNVALAPFDQQGDEHGTA
jgi:hypothetical protein